MPPKQATTTATIQQAEQLFDSNLRFITNSIINYNKLGVENQTVAVTRGRLQLLQGYWETCLSNAIFMKNYASEEERAELPFFRENLMEIAEQRFLAAYDFFNNKLAPTDVVAAPPTGVPATVISSDEVQLPKSKLPTFSGNVLDWLTFRDLFCALVKNRASLSNVQKHQYLLSSVTGEALKLISHLPLAENNFDVAWTKLTDCYENNRVIIDAHLERLCTIPNVTSNPLTSLKQLRANTSESINALRVLECPVDEWNNILVYLLTQKLDKESHQQWEVFLGSDKTYPKLPKFYEFLEMRIRSLEAGNSHSSAESPKSLTATINENSNAKRTSFPTRKSTRTARNYHSTAAIKCILCAESHRLMHCTKFLALPVSEREELTRNNNLCRNCLTKGHHVANCRSSFSCSICRQQHHTLLHRPANPGASSAGNSAASSALNSEPNFPATSVHAHMGTSTKPVLLATARVLIAAKNGRSASARALIDQGSDATFISTRLVRCLCARLNHTRVEVTGIGNGITNTVKHSVQIQIRAVTSNTTVLFATALVVPQITSYIPAHFPLTDSPFFSKIALADDYVNSTDEIDLLLGADLYGSILLGGLLKDDSSSLIAQETIFGWVVSGPLASTSDASRVQVHHSTCINLDVELRRFWELEEVPNKTAVSAEASLCEQHFVKTHSRDPCGRYIVRLPFKSGPPINIGESKSIAMRSLLNIERRLSKLPEISKQYVEFLSEYEASGHMQKMENIHALKQPTYLPHHPVIRKDHVTTKLRVVFNASSLTSNKTSLNEHLMVGPKLQADLPALILNWRSYKYVFCADIQQMFRQILVHPDDRQYQLILWRPTSCDEILPYSLNTVTYGTASAPYLAQRVLKQLADDEGSNFPLASSILRNEIYVDDVISGAHDEFTAVQKRDQLIQCLDRAQMPIRKWASNSAEVLKGIDPSNHGLAIQKPFQDDEQLKVLGVNWIPLEDAFSFHFNPALSPSKITKRNILSTISKIFDPLGWLSPTTITLKILLQRLWKLSIDWDESVPVDISSEWSKFSRQLANLMQLRIPRWSGQRDTSEDLQLHGFADASSAAYAAVIYIRIASKRETTRLTLLMSKTKVAPVKTVSVPRLELCAAHLLARCMTYTLSSMRLTNLSVFCWSDSTIVLSWLKRSPSDLKVFVANRVSAIQTKLPNAQWSHVPTEENPADCASRGIEPDQLLSHTLWWNGPHWLHSGPERWPTQSLPDCTEAKSELRHSISVHVHHSKVFEAWHLPNEFSSWPRLLRVTVYLFRFVSRTRYPDVSHRDFQLQATEIRHAQRFWIKRVQAEQFEVEIDAIKAQKTLPSNSSLRALDPFIDDTGLLRVGGRLEHSGLPAHTKFPLLLAKHRITYLIIAEVHKNTLHGGAQLMLRTLREQFWVLGARNLVKGYIRQCVKCARQRAISGEQMMANLPSCRVNPSRPFAHCGLDYAGPFPVRDSLIRGRKAHKTYVSLFVCLTTRAVHLELVHNYSTSAFLASFERFIARRGIPSDVYSDNATTYQGADRELRAAIRQTLNDRDLQANLATRSIQWHFIPPSAPHFGGMWEAGVKSVKHHLRRVLGTCTPTVEEFTTLLCNIEACLNSRPIAPLNDDVNSCEALTPGHFLIGDALKSLPSPSVLNINEARLDRWQFMRAKYEQFWRVWSLDYLNTLQQRTKWRKRSDEFHPGDLVLLKNAASPPCKWELARVQKCLPDQKGLVRVVQVKTAMATYVRPIVKLCKLPISTTV